MTNVKRLTCCCCGSSMQGRQWWNRDTGYGLCNACIPYCRKRQDEEEMRRNYGELGVHYGLDQEGA